MIVAPAAEPISLERLFNRSWALFRHHWIVALPPLASLVVFVLGVCGLAAYVVADAPRIFMRDAPFLTGLAAAYLLVVFAAVLVGVASIVAVFGMADALWERGAAGFGDGIAAVRERTGAALLSCVGFAGLAVAALLLLIPTLGIAVLALPIVTMYVYPSIVTGRNGGFGAFAESWRLVRANFVPSLIALLILLALQYLISFLAYPAILPLEFSIFATPKGQLPQIAPGMVAFAAVGLLVALVGAYAMYAFHAIVLTGLYRAVKARTPLGAEGT